MQRDNRSAFIATRITEAQRAKIQRAAKACNESLSTFTRQALNARAAGNVGAANDATASRVRLSSNPARLAIKHLAALAANDPTAQIADLCLALGLPPDASATQIQDAVNALLASLGTATDDPLESMPDPSTPTSLARRAIEQRAARRAARAACDPLRAVQAARKEQARKR